MRRIDAVEIPPRYPEALEWFDTACPHLAVADGTRFYERAVPRLTVDGVEYAEQSGWSCVELVAVATLPDYPPARSKAPLSRKLMHGFGQSWAQVEARWDPHARVWLRHTEYFGRRRGLIVAHSLDHYEQAYEGQGIFVATSGDRNRQIVFEHAARSRRWSSVQRIGSVQRVRHLSDVLVSRTGKKKDTRNTTITISVDYGAEDLVDEFIRGPVEVFDARPKATP